MSVVCSQASLFGKASVPLRHPDDPTGFKVTMDVFGMNPLLVSHSQTKVIHTCQLLQFPGLKVELCLWAGGSKCLSDV